MLDASVALSWHFDDEGGGAAETIAQRAFLEGIAVPQHWFLEVMNGLVRGERRRRTSVSGTARFIERLEDLDVAYDEAQPERVSRALLPLARAHRLSIYDAAYLELAQREGLSLATFDASLVEAARSIGIELIEGG